MKTLLIEIFNTLYYCYFKKHETMNDLVNVCTAHTCGCEMALNYSGIHSSIIFS